MVEKHVHVWNCYGWSLVVRWDNLTIQFISSYFKFLNAYKGDWVIFINRVIVLSMNSYNKRKLIALIKYEIEIKKEN